MKKEAFGILIYALIVLAGGIIGFVKAQSVPSLIAGIVFALLMGISGVALLRDYLWGIYLGLAGSAALALFFGYRFLGSYKFMPAGLVALLSIALFVWLSLKITGK